MRILTTTLAALAIAGCSLEPPKPNKRTPSTSPSGKFVLTMPREHTGTDPNLTFWRVTISDANGTLVHKDDSEFNGFLSVYWCWDDADRVWLYNSDDGKTHIWQMTDGQWQRTLFARGNPLTPPSDLYPNYVNKTRAQPVP